VVEAPRRPELAVLMVAAGAVLIVMTTATIYSLASEYGAEGGAWASVLVWSLLPAAVLAIGLRLALQSFADRTVSWPRLLLAGYVVAALSLGVGSALGLTTHDDDRAAAAGACNDSKVATLTSIPGYDAALGTPAGQEDGTCMVTIAVRAEGDAALAQLSAAMEADGWLTSTGGDYDAMLVKSGVRVGLDQRDTSKGYTDVVVLVPGG
jgi:hypothetical protein